MQDKTLFKIALILSLIGLTILTFLPKEKVESTLLAQEEEYIEIEGRIEKITSSPKITRIQLSTQQVVPIIIFDEVVLDEHQNIKVKGRIDSYKGQKQINTEEIFVINGS